ncbi:C2 calcium-dependent domain-containing protein 6 [Manis javanica]|nr:C2 calcium-dependent domain-containing protein 6 [Manis javanica]
MPKVSNTVNNHGGRVHSLYTAPVFQRSPYASSEVTHPQGSEYSAARNLREQGQTTDLPRDRAKEGPGRRLLNMLRKTLIGSESKELEITPGGPTLVPFGDVVGCLAIHVKNCRHFTPKINLQHYNNFFIRISINNVVKCTKTCSLLHQNNDNSTMIKFNDVKYFSVQVPRHQDDKRNNIFLELMQNDTTGKYPLLLGRAQVHLYKIIKKGCFTEEFHILNKNTFICRVEAEFIFSYGNFGYGYSHQLKSLEKIIKPSMFMNIAPPPERTDPVTNVIIPQPIEYPAFLSPDLNVSVGMPATMSQSKQPFAVRLEKLHQQPRERLEKMKKEYRNLNTWMEKSNYLKGVLNSQLEHKEPKGSNTSKVPENQFEERPEDTVTSVVPLIKEEAEMIPSELLDSDDEKGLTLRDKDTSSTIAPKIDESTKQADTPLSILPSLTITEENKISPLEDYQSEAMPYGKMKNIFFPPQVKLKNRYSSILKTDSCPSEVVFSQKEYISPSFRPEYIEFKPKYQDCSDIFEDLHGTSFKRLEKAKSR